MRLQFEAFTGDDDDAALAVKRQLLDGFERWLTERAYVGAEAQDIDLLLEWKYQYGDGDYGTWSRSDVDEVLLEHLPRKLSASSTEAASIPVSLGAFVRYLDERGLLSDESDDADDVSNRAAAQRQAFLDAMDDPDNWGMAKRIIGSQGLADIEDLDQDVLDAAMSRFNALPREERDRILGDSAPDPFDDNDRMPSVSLPLRRLPSPDEVGEAAADVALLRQVDALHAAVGMAGLELTDAGNPTIADGRRLVTEVGTGDRVDDIRSSAELPVLVAVGQVALEAGAVEIEDLRLRATATWPELDAATRWERIVEAVLESGASTLSFGAARPMEAQLAEEADEGTLHFIGILWLTDEPVPLEVFVDVVHTVVTRDPRHRDLPVSRRSLHNLCRARVGEVFGNLVRAGIVKVADELVELLPTGAAVVAPILQDAGYEILMPGDVVGLTASELLDLMAERDEHPGNLTCCWETPAERSRLAHDLVTELHGRPEPERVLLGVGLLDALGDAAVPALRSAVDTAIAPQAWLLLVSAGAASIDDLPLGMLVQASIETFVGMAQAGAPADVIESILGHVPVADHAGFVDQLAGTDHPRTAELLEMIGRHHPDKPTAKHARKVAHRWRSRHAARRQ